MSTFEAVFGYRNPFMKLRSVLMLMLAALIALMQGLSPKTNRVPELRKNTVDAFCGNDGTLSCRGVREKV